MRTGLIRKRLHTVGAGRRDVHVRIHEVIVRSHVISARFVTLT
jgi:hypothetical protein